MISKFKATTGTSQFNFKDHADPVLACKPTLDGSMIASGAADYVVSVPGTAFTFGTSFFLGSAASSVAAIAQISQRKSAAAGSFLANYRNSIYK